MLKFLTFLIVALSAITIFAGETYKCTAWTKQDGVSCIFAGEEANIFKRQCENPCHQDRSGNGNMGPNCDMEDLCHFNDPSTFNGVCSDWTPVSGVTCYDPNSQSWEQKWVRSCTVGLRDTWCSREIPLN